MGLDCSHDAFHGAYSAFNRFRKAVARAMNGSFPPHDPPVHPDGTRMEDDSWYWGDGYTAETHPGIALFLSHEDCDGILTPEECLLVARDLEGLLPMLDTYGPGDGHIARAGGYGEVARQFIAGCLAAAAAQEDLVFA